MSPPIAEFEQQVRERAYGLWEQEGRPAGRDAEHWRKSEQAMRAELAAAPAKPSKPRAAAAKAPPALRKARAAAIAPTAH